MGIRIVILVLTAVLLSACGGGGGVKICGALLGAKPCKKEGSEAQTTQPSPVAPVSNSGSNTDQPTRPASPDVTFTRMLITDENTPVLFELDPPNPDSVLHTSWFLPQTGSIEFVGRRFTGVYLPPVNFVGTAFFGIQIERTDGTHERTNVTVQIQALERLKHPWACPSSVISSESVVHIAAHPNIAGALVAGRRNGQALESIVSADGGATWQTGEILPVSDIQSFRFDPDSSGVVIAEAGESSWISRDGGLTWDVPSQEAEFIEAESPNTVYSFSGNSLYRSDNGGQNQYLVTSLPYDIVAIAADPTQSRRIYVLAQDGLYWVFRDGTPGFDITEGEQLIWQQMDLGGSYNDVTVDSHGRVYAASEAGISCLMGDAPFQPGGEDDRLAVSFDETDGDSRVIVDVEPVDESTEITVWLQSHTLTNGGSGIMANAPTVVHERILSTGEPARIEFPLDPTHPGIYQIAAVMRTLNGVVGRTQNSIALEQATGEGARSSDLALTVSHTELANGLFRFQATMWNVGLEDATGVALVIENPFAADLQLMTALDERAACVQVRNSPIARCWANSAGQTLTPQDAPIIVNFDVRGESGYIPRLRMSAVSDTPELYPTDNNWDQDSRTPLSDLVVSSRSVLGTPEPNREIVFNVSVTNNGPAPVTTTVTGSIETDSGRILNHGDWIVDAEGADCVMPIRYCAAGQCSEVLTRQQHYSCTFDEPLVSEAQALIRVGLTAGEDGETVTNVALARGGWEVDSFNNLSVIETTASVRAQTPAPQPSPGDGQTQCAGLLVLLTFGACLQW